MPSAPNFSSHAGTKLSRKKSKKVLESHELITPKRKLAFEGDEESAPKQPKEKGPTGSRSKEKSKVDLSRFTKDGPPEPFHDNRSDLSDKDWPATQATSPASQPTKLVRSRSKGAEKHATESAGSSTPLVPVKKERVPTTAKGKTNDQEDEDMEWERQKWNVKHGLPGDATPRYELDEGEEE